MADAEVLRLPLPDPTPERTAEVALARAIRLALLPAGVEDAAAEIREVVHGDRHALTVALARAERALASEWSDVVARAVLELREARRCA